MNDSNRNPFSKIRKVVIDPDGTITFYFDTFGDRAEFLRLVPEGKVYGSTRYNTALCAVKAGWWLRWKPFFDGLPSFTIQEELRGDVDE